VEGEKMDCIFCKVIKDAPRHILDFAREVTRLRKDTGVEISSCNYKDNPAMITDNKGNQYYLVWNKDLEEYEVAVAI
jgi:hypothetical protein